MAILPDLNQMDEKRTEDWHRKGIENIISMQGIGCKSYLSSSNTSLLSFTGLKKHILET
jgi:hypothetical protein